MVKPEAGNAAAWAARDWVAAAGLFVATAAVILWQNSHIVVLWDLSYVLDTAARIAAGQMPYRDFPLVHSPLTFVVQAAIMRLTGRVLFHHTLYVAAMGGLSTLLTWRIALRVLGAWGTSLLLCAPLAVVGIYCILPHPSYDCDCAFSMLVAVWFLLRLDDDGASWVSGFAAGVAACVPVFFKQNMGLPFLAAVLGAAAVMLVFSPGARSLWSLLAGAVATLAAAVLVLHFTAGIGNYVQWTMRFAGQRRMPTAGAMFSVYGDPQLLWTVPCLAVGAWLLWRSGGEKPRSTHNEHVPGMGHPILRPRGAGASLLSAPFLWTLASLLRSDNSDDRAAALLAVWPILLIAAWALGIWNVVRLRRAPRMRAFLPLILLVGITGTFMSQQLWGSTYAIWPLLVLLIAELVAALPNVQWVRTAMAVAISLTLLVCGGFYVASEERLDYAQFPAGPAVRSATPALKGMATPGPYVPELDELLRYAAANIPMGDGLILIPGEDPFYFATGRVPQFPVLLFDPSTDPYSPAEVAELAQARNIRWLVVKRDRQIVGNPAPDPDALMQALMREFEPVAQLRGYDVYGRGDQRPEITNQELRTTR